MKPISKKHPAGPCGYKLLSSSSQWLMDPCPSCQNSDICHGASWLTTNSFRRFFIARMMREKQIQTPDMARGTEMHNRITERRIAEDGYMNLTHQELKERLGKGEEIRLVGIVVNGEVQPIKMCSPQDGWCCMPDALRMKKKVNRDGTAHLYVEILDDKGGFYGGLWAQMAAEGEIMRRYRGFLNSVPKEDIFGECVMTIKLIIIPHYDALNIGIRDLHRNEKTFMANGQICKESEGALNLAKKRSKLYRYYMNKKSHKQCPPCSRSIHKRVTKDGTVKWERVKIVCNPEEGKKCSLYSKWCTDAPGTRKFVQKALGRRQITIQGKIFEAMY